MKIRWHILGGLLGLLIIQLILLYISMFVTIPRFGDAVSECLVTLLIAVLLVYPASWIAHLKNGKQASLCAMVWVVLICLLTCFIFWSKVEGVDALLPAGMWGQVEKKWLGIVFSLIIAGLIQTLAMYLKQFQALKISSWLLVGLTAYFALLQSIGLVMQAAYGRGELYITSNIVGTFLGLILVCIFVGRWHWHKCIGLGFLLVVAGLSAYSILVINNFRAPYAQWILSLIAFAMVYAHANILWQMPFEKGWAQFTRILTQGIVCAAVGILFIKGCLWLFDNKAHGNGFDMLVALPLFMGIIAMVMTGVLLFKFGMDQVRINREPQVNHINYSQLTVICPHCKTQQLLTESGQSCGECRLQFKFSMIEPHCPTCNYLLIGYNKDTCPECGQAI